MTYIYIDHTIQVGSDGMPSRQLYQTLRTMHPNTVLHGTGLAVEWLQLTGQPQFPVLRVVPNLVPTGQFTHRRCYTLSWVHPDIIVDDTWTAPDEPPTQCLGLTHIEFIDHLGYEMTVGDAPWPDRVNWTRLAERIMEILRAGAPRKLTLDERLKVARSRVLAAQEILASAHQAVRTRELGVPTPPGTTCNRTA